MSISLQKLIYCPECQGNGTWIVSSSMHDPNCEGDCKNCPVEYQEQQACHFCSGTGQIAVWQLMNSDLDNFEKIRILKDSQ